MKKLLAIAFSVLMLFSVVGCDDLTTGISEDQASSTVINSVNPLSTPSPTPTPSPSLTPTPSPTPIPAAEPQPAESVYEQPVQEEPAQEEYVYEEPEPVQETSIPDAPVYEEPVYEEPAYEEPAYEEPVYEEPQGDLVWIPTRGGKKYHSRSGCSGMKDPAQVTRDAAISQGFDACKKCY